MRNFSNNNFSDWRKIHKSHRNEFANAIVAKISESVDFKKFLQAVFDEKILTETQEKALKLLYGCDDGIVRNVYQVEAILWSGCANIAFVRWDAFVKILQSEIYKDLFPEEDEENYSFSDDVIKQKREEILKNLDDDLDNYEYHIDDLMTLENTDVVIRSEEEVEELINKMALRERLYDFLNDLERWGSYKRTPQGHPPAKHVHRNIDIIKQIYWLGQYKNPKSIDEIAQEYGFTKAGVRAIHSKMIDWFRVKGERYGYFDWFEEII